MRYRDKLTGGFVVTDKELGSRYEKVHEVEDCWCQDAPVESRSGIPAEQRGFMDAIRRSFGEEE